MSWIAVGASAVSAGVSYFGGQAKKNKANSMLNNLKEVPYTIPQEILDNQKMAQMRATGGMPSAQYQNAAKDIQRNSNAAIQQAVDRRGGVGLIGGIQGQANDATNNLNVADAQTKIANEKTLYGINNDVASFRDKEYAAKKDIYDRDYNYAMSLKGAGNQQIEGALDKGLSAAAMGVNAGMGQGLFGGAKVTNSGNATSRVNGTSYYGRNTATSRYAPIQQTETYDEREAQPVTAQPASFGGSLNYGLMPNWKKTNWLARPY